MAEVKQVGKQVGMEMEGLAVADFAWIKFAILDRVAKFGSCLPLVCLNHVVPAFLHSRCEKLNIYTWLNSRNETHTWQTLPVRWESA